jgi:hypothetical protein
MTATIGGGLAVVWRKIIRPVLLMAQDWNGAPARAGVAHRPGVMERLDKHDQMLTSVAAEVSYNHGGSIKDAVDRMDKRLAGVETDVRGIHSLLEKDS